MPANPKDDLPLRSRRRRACALLVTVATAVLVSGCSSSDDWSQPHAKPTAVGTLGLLVDDELPRKELKGTDVQFIADRIKALVKAGKLESAGNLNRWRFSEIRLTGK